MMTLQRQAIPTGATWWKLAAVLLAAFLVVTPLEAATGARKLDQGWRFRAIGSEAKAPYSEWHPASVPGVVQTDLLQDRLIPDPFTGTNESRLQWIGQTDWEYETEFDVDAATLAHKHVELVFDGLDTLAEVSVNGHPVLSADNMFRRWRVDCRDLLRPGKNTLNVSFRSPTAALLPWVSRLPYHLPSGNTAQIDSELGYSIDPYIRKAGYHFGWDWGPRFVTMGIWRAVRLETWDDARISDLYIAQKKIGSDVAEVEAEVEIDAASPLAAKVTIEYLGPDERLISKSIDTQLDAGTNLVKVPLRIEHPRLWYPNGYGAQDRYRFTARVSAGKDQDEREVTTGLRSVELRRVLDAWGKSFEFVVNGVPIFAKGANLIPFDSFLPRVSRQRYRAVLSAAREAHMNMLRAWGGGAYESDDFYDLCDELGIMVWQEFMFGGALVPGGREFQESVRSEAIDNVRRLRNHPSIALWCGNNEVETGWKHWDDRLAFKNSISPEQRDQVWEDYVVMFRDILKSVVATYEPDVAYWPSSPGANFDTDPPEAVNGDMHYWTVWHGLAPVEDYTKQLPRFMSEYGFQSFPEMATLRTFANVDEMRIDSPAMLAHQKNTGGNEKIQTYLLREFGAPRDFATFVYLSQVQQAEAIRVGAEHLRRQRPRTMGSLYWQLNDCWPGASWSSIDYAGRWKALQYYAARFYAGQLVSPWHHDQQIDVYVINDPATRLRATVRVRLMTFDGKTLYDESHAIDAAPQASTLAFTLKDADLLRGADARDVVAVFDLTSGTTAISRNEVFFAPAKELRLPSAPVAIEWKPSGGQLSLQLTSKQFAGAVALSFGDLDVHASDNYFDLLPGESRNITLETTASPESVKRSLQIMTLADALHPSTQR